MTTLASPSPLTQNPAQGMTWQFDAIYEQFRERIYRYIRHLVSNQELAEDLTQDTFLRAFKALPRMSADLKLAAWLYRIATNVSYDALRRHRLIAWQPLETLEMELFGGEGDDPQARCEQAELVRQALSHLPATYRQALLLYTEQGYTYAQIAQALGIAQSGVKMCLSRARRALRAHYAALQQELEVE